MKARPTIYNGIRMRSRLEARFAAWLDDRQWTWTYEPVCFATRNGQYLPDFLVEANGQRYYIELKPTLPLAEAALSNGDIIRASDPSARFAVVWPQDEELVGRLHPSRLVQEQYDGRLLIGPWNLLSDVDPESDPLMWIEGRHDLAPPPAPLEPVTSHRLLNGTQVWLPSSPEEAALLALVHHRDDVAPILLADVGLTTSMFVDMKNRAVFEALAATASLQQAIVVVDAEASELLARLSIAELDGNPHDAVAGLVREATRRTIKMLAALGQELPIYVHRALVEITEPATRQSSIETLTQWLTESAA